VNEQSRSMHGGTFRDSRRARETATDAGLAQHRTCPPTIQALSVRIPAPVNQSIAELPGAFHAMSTPAVHLDLR
jgi:hypothetical protein